MSQYNFNDRDLEEIKDSVSFPDIFDYLGISYKKAGNNIDFICPVHHATHYGGAKFNARKNICKCFVCDKVFSVFDLVQAVNNTTFIDSVIAVAEYAGIAHRYLKNPEDAKKKVKYAMRPLKKHELKLLDFADTSPSDSYNIVGVSPYKLSDEELPKGYICEPAYDGDYYYICERYKYSFNDFIAEDPLRARVMILEHADTKIKKLERNIRWYEQNIVELDFLRKSSIAELTEQLEKVRKLGNEFGLQRVLNEMKKAQKG